MSAHASMRAPASIPDSLPDSAQHGGSDNERAYNVLWTEWKKKAFVEFYLQLQSLYVYRRIHNSITYPMILLSTIAGATIFSSNSQAIQYVAATFSMLSALLTGMLRQIRPGEIATEHLSAMRRWSTKLRLRAPPSLRDLCPLRATRQVLASFCGLSDLTGYVWLCMVCHA